MSALTPQVLLPPSSLPPGFSLLAIGTLMRITPTGGLEVAPAGSPRGSSGYSDYGGATITMSADARGVYYKGCDSRGPDGDFKFNVFEYSTPQGAPVDLQYRATGRGSISVNHFNGQLEWIAWEGSNHFQDVIPGAVSFPPMGGSGRIWLQPSRYPDAVKGQSFTGSQQIDLVGICNLPGPIASAVIRFSVTSTVADVRARLGSAQDASQFTPGVQVPGIIESLNAEIAPVDGRHVTLSIVPAGQSATCWLNLLAYTPK